LVEQIGFAAEVPKARRGLGADNGDSDILNRCGKPLVKIVETGLLQFLSNASQLGGEVAQGVGGIYVLDDQIESVQRIEPDVGKAEDLNVGLETFARGLLKLGGHGDRTGLPDHALDLGQDVSPLIPLSQGEIQVAVLAT
jgi:hypothetical protein